MHPLNIFQSKCAPPAIQLATCICMFGVDAELRDTTQKLYAELLKYLIKFFQETPPARLPDVSDVLESFYSSNVKILKRIQSIYADTQANCAALIYFALLSIRMAETGPIKRAATFLTLFVKVSRNYPCMLNAILADGQHIVTTVLECINGVHLTPRTQVEVFADVLLSLNQKYPSEFVIWMKEAEQAAVSQFSLLTPEERTQFVKMVVKEKTNKRLLQDNIRRHAAKCRGILEEI
jgi:Importin 13 repeat